MRVKLLISILVVAAIFLFIPFAAMASEGHEDDAPTIEIVEQAIEKLEAGEFVEAEEDLQGVVVSEHHEGVRIDLVKQALAALENGEEDEAMELLKKSIESVGSGKH